MRAGFLVTGGSLYEGRFCGNWQYLVLGWVLWQLTTVGMRARFVATSNTWCEAGFVATSNTWCEAGFVATSNTWCEAGFVATSNTWCEAGLWQLVTHGV
jgi:hypothetical protein